MRNILFALLSGLLFGAGLTISMMVDPARVLGFLDVFGNWDPTLAFVMGGGVLVYLPIYQLYIKPRQHTIFGESCDTPDASKITAKLLIGSALFGVGWGLGGICPGPSITNLTGGLPGIMWFVISMLIGMIVAGKIKSS